MTHPSTSPQIRKAVKSAKDWLEGCDLTDGHLAADCFARALLRLHSEAEAMRGVVEAAVMWSASFGELSKRLPPHVHALRDAVDAYEKAVDAYKAALAAEGGV